MTEDQGKELIKLLWQIRNCLQVGVIVLLLMLIVFIVSVMQAGWN